MQVYNKFFGFREDPFSLTPDSSFFFPSTQHQTALDALTYAVRQRKGFVVITGPIGSGKTTVLRALLRRMDRNYKTALITNTHLSPKGVLIMLLEDLGVSYRDGSKDRLLIQLNHYLMAQVAEGFNVVLMIDEAQNLNQVCLEELRMLSNLETEKEKLIQIVLVGQPELRKKIEQGNLEQLRQRVAVHYHLVPLTQEETRNYILHRLRIVTENGFDPGSLLDEDGFSLIFEYSKGIPRVINNLCDHAFLSAYLNQTRLVSRATIEESIAEIRFQGDRQYEQVH